MIQSFVDVATADIFNGKNTKAARTFDQKLWQAITDKLDMLDAATTLADLRSPPGNHLHALKQDQEGRHAIRVNRQYRITFRFVDGHAHDVQCEDYH
ncbi:MAG TPA: type II toxin-antitoxin system RelE/ParE family toxin [Vicinamibacterales bacterium]